MTNLLNETEQAIRDSGHAIKDVEFVGSADGVFRSNWRQFRAIANVEYDSGYGGAEVPTDLIVQFTDGRKMWRGEYDGSEWWKYDALTEPYTGETKPLRLVVGHGWPTVENLHSNDPADEFYKGRGL